MPFRLRAAWFVLVALSLGSTFGMDRVSVASAQEKGQRKEEPSTGVHLETFLVQLDVTVTDKKGSLVRGLGRDDFEVYEDGLKQTLTHFSLRSAPKPVSLLATDGKGTAREEPSRAIRDTSQRERYLLFAVDDLHLSPRSLLAVKQALLRFVDEQMAEGDRVAIVTTSGSLGFLQQFMNEREVLRHVINQLSVRQRQVFQSYEVPRISDYQAELIDGGDEDALEIAVEEVLKQEPPSPRPNARERAIQQAKAKARVIVAQNNSVTSSTFRSLEEVVRSLSPLPGRKVVVLLSDGFLLGGPRNPRQADLRRITDAATRSSVMIYSMDARGLTGLIAGGDASEESGFATTDTQRPGVLEGVAMRSIGAKRDGLSALALDTGGLLVQESDDLTGAIQRVIDDNTLYYVLAYEPDLSTRQGRYRKIQVRVSGHPDYRVRTRAGYFVPGDLPSQKSKAGDGESQSENQDKEAKVVSDARMRAALGSLIPQQGIPVDLAAEFVTTPELGSVAIVSTAIDMRLLSFAQADENYEDKIELAGLAYDEHGKLAGSFGEHFDVTIALLSTRSATA